MIKESKRRCFNDILTPVCWASNINLSRNESRHLVGHRRPVGLKMIVETLFPDQGSMLRTEKVVNIAIKVLNKILDD